jgi:hypothetical protein
MGIFAYTPLGVVRWREPSSRSYIIFAEIPMQSRQIRARGFLLPVSACVESYRLMARDVSSFQSPSVSVISPPTFVTLASASFEGLQLVFGTQEMTSRVKKLHSHVLQLKKAKLLQTKKEDIIKQIQSHKIKLKIDAYCKKFKTVLTYRKFSL